MLVAPPGAGKTTVVPLRLLDEPWLGPQRIVVLEPRRLAARAAAVRIASLLGEPVGRSVGYRTRDERVGGRAVRIEVVTEGILVRRLQRRPELPGVGLVILDEVHERNLVGDLSLAFTLDVRAGLRPDLRVMAMSATPDAGRLAALLGTADRPAPVVASEGRQHPVTLRHLPPEPREAPEALVVRAVGTALAEVPVGDVLVFLAGAAEIGRVGERLRAPGMLPAHVDVRPLFGALPVADQDAALAPSPLGRRRVVLATDIAESSLTVAGVRAVVDAGSVRVPAFDPASGLTRLQTQPASVASLDQRSGRAGRLGPGVAYRLWAPADTSRRPAFAVPEIAVADLAGLALDLAVWGADPAALALPDQPPARALAEARALLRALGALDGADRPTALGRRMAELPVHPRLAALVCRGADAGLGQTAVAVAALLEERDILRGRPGTVPADLALRMDLLADRRADHPDLDRRALAVVRRRITQLAAGGSAGRDAEQQGGVRFERAAGERAKRDAEQQGGGDRVGWLVAVAHPERIAQSQGGGRFRFRGGGGGAVAGDDPLAGAEFLAVAEVVGGGAGPPIIGRAAALERATVLDLVRSDVTVHEAVAWDDDRDDVVARLEERSGALVLARSEGPASPGPATVAVLLDRVRRSAGGVLRWTPAARQLQARVGFLHRIDPDTWPDLADEALLADLDRWLAPHLVGAVGRRDLEAIDVRRLLVASLPPGAIRALDELAPTEFTAADGRAVAIAYDDGTPRAAARAQALYGLGRHPTVAGGAVPVVVELRSPADRPIQITADLPGFWAGSWAEVRKDMAGRYPKHSWPLDPATARPPERRGPRR